MKYQPYRWLDDSPRSPGTIDTPVYYNIYGRKETEPRTPVIKKEEKKELSLFEKHLKSILAVIKISRKT
jgi:hypothetical protein